MSILNIGLYGLACERPSIDPTFFGMEAMVQKLKTTAELRAAGERYPDLRKGFLKSVEKVHEVIMERLTRLSLKDVPFKAGVKMADTEVNEFFNTGCKLFFGAESTRKIGDIKRKDLDEGRLHEFMRMHTIQDPYKLEVFKGCWQKQLKILRNANAGAMPEAAIRELYRTFKCPFGCPPPATDPEVFVDMHPVPRPKKAKTGGKYQDFEECYGKETPLDLPVLNEGAPVETAPKGVLTKEKARDVIR